MRPTLYDHGLFAGLVCAELVRVELSLEDHSLACSAHIKHATDPQSDPGLTVQFLYFNTVMFLSVSLFGPSKVLMKLHAAVPAIDSFR